MAIFGRNQKDLQGTITPEYRVADTKKQTKKGNKRSAAEKFVNTIVPNASGSKNPYESPHRPTMHTYERSVYGPYDRLELSVEEDDYIDLGSLLIYPYPDMNMRLEMEEATGRIISASLDYEDSTLQLQAFSSAKNDRVWDEIRRQIITSVESQGGATSEVKGLFGIELLANLPVENAEGENKIYRQARFVGIDGPRWFLRGVFGGAAAHDKNSAIALEDIFRSVIVNRDDKPLPPKELLTFTMPSGAVVPDKDDIEKATNTKKEN